MNSAPGTVLRPNTYVAVMAETPFIENGLGFNATDDSFETLLINNGVPITATPESPAHSSVPLDKRIVCNRDVIASFIKTLAL